ncbi:transmembrane and coiled-coil domains protein 2 isoform X3 [Schistocerca nitens]|uniref:transmembrane and coiled-coil domains protein 2 isoform X3 n=1 Tax=Schistocerca nitens TaxID=7011 RepID=UPI002118C047|nr:transmembrane and coiled-coil domains protein 2 isoform X3 [Schistocerca nitens]
MWSHTVLNPLQLMDHQISVYNKDSTVWKWSSNCSMDSLQVSQSQPQPQSQQGGRATTTSSRSASPSLARVLQQQHASIGDSGRDVTMSSSIKGRRRSPVAASGTGSGSTRRGGSDGGMPAAAAAVGASTSPQPFAVTSDDTSAALTPSHHHDEETELYHPSTSMLSNGSSEHVTAALSGDEVDGHSMSDLSRTRAAIEHMQSKIGRTKEMIRDEQTTRDDNVNEYLKLAANADKHQLPRIKAVFEKKNQKSAQSISQLQKKLESYNKRLRELETHGLSSSHRQPREVLRDMGQGLKNVGGNIRDGITGFSGTVMSKPREFAHLIKNKFGSADNINQLARNGDGSSVEDEKAHHGSATLPGGCSLTSTHASSLRFPSDENSECSSVTSESLPAGGGHQLPQSPPPHQPAAHHTPQVSFSNLESILQELHERGEDCERLREELETLKQSLQQEVSFLSQALTEERFRSERLEEQVNDLTELHQNEVENLKQALADMEEKVQYQSEERLRDIHDMLDSCQTKISKMEHQQQQQQQYVTLEGLDNSNARALAVKLINVLLTVLQVILLLVATAAGIVMPFLRTRLRILTTIILVGGVVFVLKQWPELRDVGSHLIRHWKEALSVK